MLAVDIRAQHYIQACAHLSIYVYWGWYWHEVYDSAYLIAAQIVFAFAFDALLNWSLRDSYTVGLGPLPIIFSTNLFLWFKPDWFYLQFLMVAVGISAKALIRWEKGGRSAHIFNPSSFPLAIFSLALILTRNTHLTWGQEIAITQLMPPHMYLLIFLVSLPGQLLFGVASMTLAAVATTFAFGAAYHAATGSYFFFEPGVPIAVFLGMHLLFTDPSTAPRTELGRLIFGALYGISVIALYAVLDRVGAPTFYDKLLGVPILNLTIQFIDRATRSDLMRRFDPVALGRSLTPRRRHLVYIGLWAAVFAMLQAVTGNGVALARADVLASFGHKDEAIRQYQQLLQRDDRSVVARNKLGFALLQSGRVEEAAAMLQRAVELQPDDPETQNNLGLALLQKGLTDPAMTPLKRAIELRPSYDEAHYNLAQALLSVDQPRAAIAELREAVKYRPDWPAALGSLAWVHASQPGDGVYDPPEAVRLATRAADLTDRKDVAVLDALAAAYAAAGRYGEAAHTAETAVTLASRDRPELVAPIRDRLNRYRAGRSLVDLPR